MGIASSSSGSPPLEQPPGIKQLNDSVWKLYSPSTGVPDVDVVFFHGLPVSDYKEAFWTTWLSRDRSVLWPKDWLSESLPKARILSISYDASPQKHDGAMEPYNIVENLIKDMLDVFVGQTCPVVLVGHSLGGIIIKMVILRAELNRVIRKSMFHQTDNFLRNCKGVFYYSTPHGGSALFDDTSFLPSMNKSLRKLVERSSKETARINSNFAGARVNRKIKTRIIVENKDTKIVVNEGITLITRVVDEASARGDFDELYTTDADHFEVCQPKDNKTCAIFQHPLAFVNEIRQSERLRISAEHGAKFDPLTFLSEQGDPNLQNSAKWASCNPSDTDDSPTGLMIAELVESLFNINDLHSRAAAAWALENLTEKATESMKLTIAEKPGAILGLVNCLSGNTTNPHLQEGAAWTLCHLTYVNLDHHPIKLRVAKEDGGIYGLVKCLAVNKPDLQEAAAWTLCHLKEVDCGSIRSSLAKENSAFVGLVKCLSAHEKPDLQQAAAWILCHLTYVEDHDDSMKVRVANEEGAIDGLLKCLTVDEPDLQEAAAWTLCHLTEVACGSIRSSLAKEDRAIVGLVKCLSVHEKPDLQQAAAWILFHVTDVGHHDDSLKLRVAEEKGAIVALKNCLSVPNEPDLIEAVKGTLRNLSEIDNESIKSRIAKEGGAVVL